MRSLIFCSLILAITPLFAQYETPGPLPASDWLSPQQRKGPSFTIGTTADPSAMMLGFEIDSKYGTFLPQSLQMARIRLNEIAALDKLSQLEQEPLFLKGAGDQLEDTARATGRFIQAPIKTMKQVPIGLNKFMTNIQARQTVGTVYGETGSPAHQEAKRDLAHRLGVDPYSDNPVLQEKMDRVAKNQNRGALVASIGTLLVPGGAGVVVNVAEVNDDFNSRLRDKSAPELQLENYDALTAIGCNPDSARDFLYRPGYTATNSTSIVGAMQSLKSVKDVCALLDRLPADPGAEGVLYVQTQLQMAARYHTTRGKLVRMQMVEDTPVWWTEAGSACIFAPLDYLYWNESLEKNVKALTAAGVPAGTTFYIAGQTSPGAREQLAQLQFQINEKAMDALWGTQ